MSGFRLAVASGQQLVAVAGLSQEYLALRGMHVAASASSAVCCLLPAARLLETGTWYVEPGCWNPLLLAAATVVFPACTLSLRRSFRSLPV